MHPKKKPKPMHKKKRRKSKLSTAHVQAERVVEEKNPVPVKSFGLLFLFLFFLMEVPKDWWKCFGIILQFIW